MTDYRTVPVEPTEEMIAAGERAAWDDDNSMPAIRAMTKAWSAMLAAAPALSASPALAGDLSADMAALRQLGITAETHAFPAGDLVERVAGIIRALKVTDYDSADEIARAVIAAMQPGVGG